jgi:hypothetical protein
VHIQNVERQNVDTTKCRKQNVDMPKCRYVYVDYNTYSICMFSTELVCKDYKWQKCTKRSNLRQKLRRKCFYWRYSWTLVKGLIVQRRNAMAASAVM